MNAAHARLTATAFLEAYRRCSLQRHPIDEGQEGMFLPALICAAFAAEVGLKALLLQDGELVTGHDLYDLFDRLSPELKESITGLTGIDSESFMQRLLAARRAFIDWRYMFEFQDERSISLEFVARFATAVVRTNPRP